MCFIVFCDSIDTEAFGVGNFCVFYKHRAYTHTIYVIGTHALLCFDIVLLLVDCKSFVNHEQVCVFCCLI